MAHLLILSVISLLQGLSDPHERGAARAALTESGAAWALILSLRAEERCDNYDTLIGKAIRPVATAGVLGGIIAPLARVAENRVRRRRELTLCTRESVTAVT